MGQQGPRRGDAGVTQFEKEYRHAFLIDPLVDIRIIGAATPAKADFLDVKDYLGEVYALFFQGFTDCQEGKYEECHGRFVTLIREINGEKFPERIPNSVLWYKGLAAAHLGKYDIAEQHYRLLMDRDPGGFRQGQGAGGIEPGAAPDQRVPLHARRRAAAAGPAGGSDPAVPAGHRKRHRELHGARAAGADP